MPEGDMCGVAAGGHIDDLVDAFALGVLERDAADRAANHAATCGRCARQLGAAEAAVVALAEATTSMVAPPEALGARIRASLRETKPRGTRRSALLAYAALAATLSFVVGTGFEVHAIFDMRRAAAENDVALLALVNSHFTHQGFERLVPTAPAAKVLLGRSPHWLYVIVDTPGCRCRVFATTASGVRDLGQPVGHERTSTLFVADVVATRIDLRADGRNIATVRLPNLGARPR